MRLDFPSSFPFVDVHFNAQNAASDRLGRKR
jgi:hypothetical protein